MLNETFSVIFKTLCQVWQSWPKLRWMLHSVQPSIIWVSCLLEVCQWKFESNHFVFSLFGPNHCTGFGSTGTDLDQVLVDWKTHWEILWLADQRCVGNGRYWKSGYQGKSTKMSTNQLRIQKFLVLLQSLHFPNGDQVGHLHHNHQLVFVPPMQ